MEKMNDKIKKLIAAVYKRVSSDEQAKGYSLIFQEEADKEAIQKDGNVFNKRHIYSDDGYTGINGNRPALIAMKEAAKRGEIDIVYVWKLDRLFRNTKLLLEFVDEMEKLGVKVKSVTEPYDTSTNLGRYIFTTLAAGAEMEHGNINERTYQGKVRAMRDGKWLSGMRPYGYDSENSYLKVNKEEAKWVRKFFRWFVNERLTLYQLQQRVNSLGITTKHVNIGREIKTGRKTSKTFWNKRTLGRILGNEIYTGIFCYRKYKYPGKTHKETELRPEKDWIITRQPTIISRELFDDVQKQLRINKANSPRKTKRLYMFAKKLVCGVCEHKISAAFRNPKKGTNESGTKYYKGAWVHKHGTDKRCENCYFYAEPRLDNEVWKALTELLSNPEIVIKRIESHILNGKSYTVIEEEIEKLEKQLLFEEGKKQKAFTAYTDGYVDYSFFQKVAVECDRSVETIKNRKQELAQSLLSEEEKNERIASAKELYKKVKKTLNNASYEVRCKVINIFVESITLTGNNATIEMYLPYKDYMPLFMPQFKQVAYNGGIKELLWDTRRVDRTV